MTDDLAPRSPAAETASLDGGLTGQPPGRRRFLGYLITAPVLVMGVKLGLDTAAAPAADAAEAVIPTPPLPADIIDLGDILILAAAPTANMLTLTVNSDGTVDFLLPREEVGQGITTSIAMLVADEMGIALPSVHMHLQPADPALVFNQLTGGSNSIRSLYTPVRTVAAAAKGRLLAAAAAKLQVEASELTVTGGVVRAPNGRTADYGSLSAAAANPKLAAAAAPLRPAASFTIVGQPTNRIDALDMVTGAKKYTLDLTPADLGGVVPMPTMVRRPPTINGTVVSVSNVAAVKAMPGILGVTTIPTGVAVVGQTFGQCLNAVDALNVSWGPGTADNLSNDTVAAALKAANLPILPPPPLVGVVDAEFDWAWASHAPMETNCAIAHVTSGSATIWAPAKSPITALQTIAQALKMPQSAVTFNVIAGGGSFGRKLFFDAALEAALISQALSMPVKLMWHRTDDIRHGRMHPQAHHHIQATYALGNVLTFQHHVASVETDFRHGLGEILTAEAASLPLGLGNMGFAQTVFLTTIDCPYNFGVVSQLLSPELYPDQFHTASMRSVYSYNTRGVEEIVVDELAAAMGQDPVAFRMTFFRDARFAAVLQKVATAGNWGRKMPKGQAQGVGFHAEYQSCTACLVELDTNNIDHFGRKIPRVTKATIAVDAGLPINPRGLQAAMISGLTDAISYTLLAGVHIINGLPQEGSYAEYHFARQYQSPRVVNVFVMPPSTGKPGGSGELGVPAAVGAIGNAYARATGIKPRSFPLFNPAYSSDFGTPPAPPSVDPPEPVINPPAASYPLPY
jgi:isoquinoline 1-oxidoreductase beta subunit